MRESRTERKQRNKPDKPKDIERLVRNEKKLGEAQTEYSQRSDALVAKLVFAFESRFDVMDVIFTRIIRKSRAPAAIAIATARATELTPSALSLSPLPMHLAGSFSRQQRQVSRGARRSRSFAAVALTALCSCRRRNFLARSSSKSTLSSARSRCGQTPTLKPAR